MYLQLDTHADYRHLVSYETEGRTFCHEESYTGCCDMICRCFEIERVILEPFSPKNYYYESFRTRLTSPPEGKLENYLADRFLAKTLTTEMFEASWSASYYGDEIDAITMNTNSSAYHEFQKKLDVFNSLSTITDRVRMVLTLEYGYLLPEIQAVEEWEIRKLSPKEVDVSPETLSRVKEDVVGSYSYRAEKLPVIGVAVPKGGRLRLVDGFHRWSAFHFKKKRRKVPLLVPVGT